jgi:hypothetical protein
VQLQEVSSFNKTLLTQKVKLEHSLEKKVLETTELSERIVMLETKLDSIKDTCKGYASFHSPPLRMIYMYVVKWMFYHGVDGYI